MQDFLFPLNKAIFEKFPNRRASLLSLEKVPSWEGFLTTWDQNRTANASHFSSSTHHCTHYISEVGSAIKLHYKPSSVHWLLGGFRYKLIPLTSHSSAYPRKLTIKARGFMQLLNGNEKFLKTISLLGSSYGKEREEEKPFPSKTFTEKRCAS